MDADKIPALTIDQPWAWAIAAGHKRVENRVWSTKYRGPLVIHAGKSTRSMPNVAMIEGLGIVVPKDLTFSAILCVVDLVDVVELGAPSLFDPQTNDPFATGPFCWKLENVRALSVPIPFSGKQGLWHVERSVVGELLSR